MAKAIMIQGTMSSVGKSFITAALCRIFSQDGYRTAPFKSQNMALNSFITCEGLEIGRAQAMQAEAAGAVPSVNMNPILLKPTSDTGSQVVLNGKSIGNMSAREYFERKKDFIPNIIRAYEELESQYDIIVMEGAGSPAEINLKENDIVNMGMAKMAQAPVLLAGDIDRGGVFAQIAGTIMLLDDDERNIIKGILINKFRGDKALLRSGIEKLEEITGKPVKGIIPYVKCDIDDEDSLSERFKGKKSGIADIAVIKLSRISNFTDFNVFERINGVRLRYVDMPEKLGNPDIIILPGTKNTIEDMLILRENGMEKEIKQYAAKGGIVFGICGGYQMMGESILDSEGIEAKGEFKGMGLLPVRTVYSDQKILRNSNGKFINARGKLENLNGKSFFGYEIHMGITEPIDDSPKMTDIDGVCKGNIYGTYIHGIFDSIEIAETIVNTVINEKGIYYTRIKSPDVEKYKQEQYDILAETLRSNADIESIYEIIFRGL